ncbi:uncharacterized protein LOC117252428 [Epinephelus lanceolatus]|uniref:uncharacterized protein LOC117252428 n=1 Tax=Epinephelus lanceolatus TaxID=310571 RepID=UPI0014474F80|nr:uncharacterized protein LOC117252428 [Epinephelus lanceolatus]XP_033475189.1 uncharacterized protein LOC117252428 [Epinephelus lanceolatus]
MTLRRAAESKGDTRMLAIVSYELVAAEGHYHRSCYRLYTKKLYKDKDTVDADMDKAESPYESAERMALQKVFTYIREDLIEHPRVIPFRDLTSILVTEMTEGGISQIIPNTKRYLRRKVEAEFGESLHIIANGPKNLLVYPNSLTMDELVKVCQELKDELKVSKSSSDISEVALKIRHDIRNQVSPQVWPPHVSDLEKMNCAPASLVVFLQTLLAGTSRVGNSPSKRVQRLTASFSQDLVYAVTCGKVKPTKHIVLPFAVKSLTGNVELIHILNRLGHGVSYSQVEEIDKALCLQKQAASGDVVPLPQNIKPGLFTTLAWDNIDRLEETLSGEGTSHRVNGIAVQAKYIDDHPAETRHLPCIPKTKKRSIGAVEMVLPIYNAGKRANPPVVQTVDADHTTVLQDAADRNHMWLIARHSNNDICSWTGFNILTHSDTRVQENSIGYLPTINAPATQLSTANEVLHQSMSIMKSLQLNNIVVVFDQALYAKAAEITWKHPEKFKNIILRMGVFHTSCIFMATIGKHFADAGLRDLCVEAGVIAHGSVAGVIDGHRYNREIRLHKLLYEAFLTLAWKGFHPWLEENHPEDLIHLKETLQAVGNLCEEVSQPRFEETLEQDSCQRTLTRFSEFLNYLREDNGPLSAFWMSYLDMVEILLSLIQASREGNQMMHLAAIRAIIPWCFAYDKLNYARYLPYYYAQMSCLDIDYPDVSAHFVEGGFSVQLGRNNPFGKIPVDQTIEETINKDTQTAGETKGFSLKTAAVTKYYLTSENRSRYLRQLRNMTGNEPTESVRHHDLQKSRIEKDRADVNAFVELMQKGWVNPLGPEESDIISLSTGITVSPNIASDLLQAQQTGEKAYKKFRSERLEKGSPTAKFHDKMKKQNLKTFSSTTQSRVNKGQNKEVVLKADRNLFGHMIIVSQSRDLHIKAVLAHPLGPLPWALSNPDGSLRKTNKAALARELEKSGSAVEDIGKQSACIIDGMSLVQKLKGDGKTFGEIAGSVLNLVLHEGGHSEQIDVVFDVYRKKSIKNAERCNRGSASSTQWTSIAPGHKVVQWRKLLSNADSKTALITFIVDQWEQPENLPKLKDKQLFAACGDAIV